MLFPDDQFCASSTSWNLFDTCVSRMKRSRTNLKPVGDKWLCGKVLIHGNIEFNELF